MRNMTLLFLLLVTFPFFTTCKQGSQQRLAGEEKPDLLAINKALVRRDFEEIWNQGKVGVIDEIYAAGLTFHLGGIRTVRGAEGLKAEVRGLRKIFPDWNARIDDILAEGDKVAVRFTCTGTHTGGNFGGIPPTGAKLTFGSQIVYRMAQGKIVEMWEIPDLETAVKQAREAQQKKAGEKLPSE